MPKSKLKYRRILLKISGEVLGGKVGRGVDFVFLRKLCGQIKKLKAVGTEIAIVLGGGNYWRYRDFKDAELDRVNSDYIGMLATIMNSVLLQDELRVMKIQARVFSALPVNQFVKTYNAFEARRELEAGTVVICAGGTGNPFCTTDLAAALRAGELDCELLVKATNVDFVYDRDPHRFPRAKAFSRLSYDQVLEKRLEVMDLSAVAIAKETKVPMTIFNLNKPEKLLEIVKGKAVGTFIN